MNPLDVDVSYFKNCRDTDNPATINLLTFLRSEKHRRAVENVRAEPDKESRAALKSQLSAITPSGVFTRRAGDALVKHSGLIAGDIDFDKNPYNPESIKRQVAKIANVAYCGLSVSGRGVWFLVPVGFSYRHKEHFTALADDFARLGIVLDPAPSNVASLRFYSYDPAAYFNESATPYWKLPQPETERSTRTTTTTWGESLAHKAARYLIDTRAAVAFDYGDYLRICGACKTEWGDDGETIAWDILENSPAFVASNFRKDFAAHWNSLKRNGGNVTTGATLVHLARLRGFDKRGTTWQQKPTAPPMPPIPKAPGVWQAVTMHGQTFEVETTSDGYPVMWDDPHPIDGATLANTRPQVDTVFIPARECSTPHQPPAIDTRGLTDREKRAIAAAVKSNPASADLIARFDLKLEGVTPFYN